MAGSRRRRTVAVGIAVAAVLAGTAAAVGHAARSSSGTDPVPVAGDRRGSRVAPHVTVTTAAPPATYRIRYRHDGDHVAASATTLEARRPFDAREETTTATSAGAATDVTIESLGRFQHGNLVLAVPPAPASLDVQPRATLPDALAVGLVQPRERRVVAGRACQVYRSATDPLGGAITPWHRGDRAWHDVCIDGAGLVLEHVTVTAGKVTDRRVAERVEVGVNFPDDRFRIDGTPVPVQKGGGAFATLAPSSRLPGRFFDLPSAPPGFALLGRYLSRPPQPELVDNVNRERALVGGVNDVYVSGADVIIVDQGSTIGGAQPFAAEPAAERVDLGSLGSGELIRSLHGAVVRADLGGGAYVRVTGTVEAAALVELARSLVAGPGGTLDLLNGPS